MHLLKHSSRACSSRSSSRCTPVGLRHTLPFLSLLSCSSTPQDHEGLPSSPQVSARLAVLRPSHHNQMVTPLRGRTRAGRAATDRSGGGSRSTATCYPCVSTQGTGGSHRLQLLLCFPPVQYPLDLTVTGREAKSGERRNERPCSTLGDPRRRTLRLRLALLLSTLELRAYEATYRPRGLPPPGGGSLGSAAREGVDGPRGPAGAKLALADCRTAVARYFFSWC